MIGGPIVGYVCRVAAAVGDERGPRPSATRPPRPSAPGWPGPCTTGCCRCSRWCSAAARELGGEAAELGRLAGEQEVALRSLIRAAGLHGRAASRPAAGRPGRRAGRASRTRPVGDRVAARRSRSRCPRDAVDEMVAAVARLPRQRRRCTSAASARAWVLLEAFPDRVVVSVRDEGPGIPDGRLEAGRRPTGGSASPSRSAAGSPTSAGRPSCTTGAVRDRVGAQWCRARSAEVS